MARRGGISVSQAKQLEAELTGVLIEGLIRDGEVRINKFGVMQVVTRSRMVWDPKRRRMVKRKFRKAVRFQGRSV